MEASCSLKARDVELNLRSHEFNVYALNSHDIILLISEKDKIFTNCRSHAQVRYDFREIKIEILFNETTQRDYSILV